MRSDKIQEIVQASETLSQETNRLLTFLGTFVDEKDGSFDLNALIAGKDSSVADVTARIFAINGIIEKLKADEKALTWPLATLQSLENAIKKTTQTIPALITHIENFANAHKGLKQFNYDNSHAQMNDNQQVNCQPQFHALFDATEALLTTFYTNLPIFKPANAAYSFEGAVRDLRRLCSSNFGRTWCWKNLFLELCIDAHGPLP